MKKIPITFIIDDSAPYVMTPYTNREPKLTADGRPLMRFSTKEMLLRFADIIAEVGMRGKFSIIPMAGNEGDILNGFKDVKLQDVRDWLDIARQRVAPFFSICPEMLSHRNAVDLKSGKALPEREDVWASTQNRTALTPYITHALEILKKASFDVRGVTSPWYFGKEVEEEYVAALAQAIYDVYGYKSSYYFLHQLRGVPNVKPWIAYEKDDRCVVSIPAVTRDWFWETMDSTEDSEDYISRVADHFITADGKGGCIVHELELGSYPTLCTHWQSLCSNGLMTGMRAFAEVGRRINEHLLDRVEWVSFNELLDIIIRNKDSYRVKPISMQRIEYEY
ncbi:MAG: hypothetical protein IJW16_07655 [Clostridia bacterium]|nr:hypothetical protein [Clostridia bacterium]